MDIVYRKREYRIEERAREAGATVQPMGLEGGPCWACAHRIRPATRYVRLGGISLHPGCAIKQGALVWLDGPEKALIAKVAW